MIRLRSKDLKTTYARNRTDRIAGLAFIKFELQAQKGWKTLIHVVAKYLLLFVWSGTEKLQRQNLK